MEHNIPEFGSPSSSENEHSEEDISDDERGLNDNLVNNAEDAENLEEEDGNQQDPFQPPPSHAKLKEELQGRYSVKIEEPVTVTRGEALLMAVKMCQQNNSTTKQLTDTIRLINSMFTNPVLPHSGYLLDKLLLSECGAHRHFYCGVCFFYFGKLDHSTLRTKVCENCEAENVIHDLTKAPHFVIYDISVQLELLFRSPQIIENLKSPSELIANREQGIYSDLYDGVNYRKFAESVVDVDADFIISCTFCTDGSPLFSKFSTQSIWPLFLSLNELSPVLRMRNLIIGGLWFGRKEPPMDLFLLPFSLYMRRLSTEGMVINLDNVNKTVKAYALLCCVDSGARGQIQGLKTHSGYSSCAWCLHPGEWDAVRRHVKFPNLDFIPAKRTHASIVERANLVVRDRVVAIDGVNAATPLINLGPNFDLAEGQVVEYMHNILLGLVKQFIKWWMKYCDEEYYIGDEETIETLNNKLKLLRPPVEVRRFPRDISAWKHWTARDLENFLLYYSIPVLTDVLPRKYLDHWILLRQSIYLLLQREITESQLKLAQEYMIHFTVQAEQLYGVGMMTFNMHIGTHLFDHVRRWGPIFTVSGFAYETGNKTLKELIHSQHGIPHQVCRALSLKMAAQIMETQCSSLVTKGYIENLSKQRAKKCLSLGKVNYFGSSEAYIHLDEEGWLLQQANINPANCVVYRKIVKENCLYTVQSNKVKRTNNCIVQLQDKSFLLLKKFILDQAESKGFVFGCKVTCSILRRLPQEPRNSVAARYLLKLDYVSDDLTLVPIDNLFTVCFHSHPLGNMLIPVPNLINLF